MADGRHYGDSFIAISATNHTVLMRFRTQMRIITIKMRVMCVCVRVRVCAATTGIAKVVELQFKTYK